MRHALRSNSKTSVLNVAKAKIIEAITIRAALPSAGPLSPECDAVIENLGVLCVKVFVPGESR